MPHFNRSDAPIAQDNYGLIADTSSDPVHDASVVGFAPGVLTDWDGGADPGNVDAALDQLADRVNGQANAIAALTSDHGSLDGLADDDHAQYLLADGTRDVIGSILVTGGNELRLRASAQRVYSPGSDALALEAGSQIQARVGGNTACTMFADQLTFLAGGADDPNLAWSTMDQLEVRLGTTVLTTFKSGEMDVSGVVSGAGLRAKAGASGGTVQSNTLTGDVFLPLVLGNKAVLDRLPFGYTTTLNSGWVKIYVGTTAMVFPVWS